MFGLGVDAISQNWTGKQIALASTASNVSYLTKEEKDAIKYINLARLYPGLFVKNELKNNYQDDYTKSLIKFLESMKPIKALLFDEQLYTKAKCFAEESGKNGQVGHERKKGSNCILGFNIAECCAYGNFSSGREIAVSWLIDRDVPSLGHRLHCLGRFSKIGLNVNVHKKHVKCSVAQFK